jgi:hypothetical protein
MEITTIFPTDVETSKDFALILYAAKQTMLSAERSGEDQHANSNETHHEPKLSWFGGVCPRASADLWIASKLSTDPQAKSAQCLDEWYMRSAPRLWASSEP